LWKWKKGKKIAYPCFDKKTQQARSLIRGHAMKQNYTKNNDKTTDIYNDNLFFDNDLYESEANLPQFNLERLARHAAQQVIQHAVEMELSEFLEREKYAKTAAENFRGYRNGHHKQRTISTSFGSLEVRVPRVSDTPQEFQSSLVKKYKRRSEGLDCLFPNLFVEGLATRDARAGLEISGRRISSALAVFDLQIEHQR
jgi:histone H3/H4